MVKQVWTIFKTTGFLMHFWIPQKNENQTLILAVCVPPSLKWLILSKVSVWAKLYLRLGQKYKKVSHSFVNFGPHPESFFFSLCFNNSWYQKYVLHLKKMYKRNHLDHFTINQIFIVTKPYKVSQHSVFPFPV